MIYVRIEAVKSEDRGIVIANGWRDTDDVPAAFAAEFAKLERMWADLGHGAAVTYRVTIAPDASPNRTRGGAPLPVEP